MAGVFDRLQKRLDEKRKEEGFSVLDLADLPPALRRVMRLLLRQTKTDYAQLLIAIEQLPEEERLTPAGLEEALNQLSEEAWLVRIGAGERAIYKINLRRRAGSNLSPSLWQTLDAKLKK